MENLRLLMLLLPVVFMIHDFEEIIMFRSWLAKNREELNKRFPGVAAFMGKHQLFDLSTSAFAVAVAHEFVLITAVSTLAVFAQSYGWWFAAFMAYFLHLFVHIAQWIVYRKYVPVIITSLATLPYCVYVFWQFESADLLSPLQMSVWTLIGIVVTILSFPSAFYFSKKFNRWEKIQRRNKWLKKTKRRN